MFKKKQYGDGFVAPKSLEEEDEDAYEGAWYRRLKALAERPAERNESAEAAEGADGAED